MIQACAAAGSTGGLAPAAATVVFMSMYSQPKLNPDGNGSAVPPTCTRCASAGHGASDPVGGCGENGKLCGTDGCSCSSKITSPSWPSGYQAGCTPGVAGQVNGPWLTFESRQHSSEVPALKAPPFR